jgi:hypothetical protein
MNISQREEFRYWFAGLAMQALIPENMKVEETVQLAKEFADALIAELDKKGGEK